MLRSIILAGGLTLLATGPAASDEIVTRVASLV